MKFPTDTLCLVCQTVFQQPQRPQGGGKRTIYCSPRCRSLDWVRGNGTKRKATVLKYDSRPENKAAKTRRTRLTTLRRYGWTEIDFLKQLQRQAHKCYGCMRGIDQNTARIDHDHKTGKVRGLLCNSCNWTLGYTNDSPMVLRRLMAYLDYAINQTNVYLIGALKNPRIPRIGNAIRQLGFNVMDEWWTPGEHADTNWQEYERLRGRSYVQALRGRSATNNYMFDRAYLDHCDIAVLCAPAGKSAMLELGYAIGSGKKGILFLDGQEPERYDIMPGLAYTICLDEEELVKELQKHI